MVPFYQEQAAAALSKTEDVVRYVRKLTSGIQSLDLYVGTGVEVTTLCTGKSAAPGVPITIMQQKLYADEELSVWGDVGENFDHTSLDSFFSTLTQQPGIVTQLFGAERAVVAVAATRQLRYYGDPWSDSVRNALNRRVTLLVRDGENLYAVSSPINSHLQANRLFPGKAEMDKIFLLHNGLHDQFGLTDREIKYMDVEYTDRLEEHEARALHYKRFLILMAGLDHRLNLFGPFYEGPKSMDFMTPTFQNRHLRFVHDDDGEGLLPSVPKPTLQKWIEEKNSYLRPGSRVLCLWRDVLNSDTAPGAFSGPTNDGEPRCIVELPERFGMAIAKQSGRNITVEVEAIRNNYGPSHGERFKLRVSLEDTPISSQAGFLVLDAVKADELESYIHDREARVDHLSYIRLFKEAVRLLREEEKDELPTRSNMENALLEAQVTADAETARKLVDDAVRAWRATHGGARLSPMSTDEYVSLFDQMWSLNDAPRIGALVESWAKAEGRTPLRLVLTGKNKLRLYTAPLEGERDDRLYPHVWVRAHSLSMAQDRIKAPGNDWVELPRNAASETTMREWEDARDWAGKRDPLMTFETKRAMLSRAEGFPASLQDFLHGDVRKHWDAWKELQQKMQSGSSMVKEPHLHFVFGYVRGRYREDALTAAVLTHTRPHVLLYGLAGEAALRNEIKRHFVGLYLDKENADRRFTDDLAKDKGLWTLGRLRWNKLPREGMLFSAYEQHGIQTSRSASTNSLDEWWQEALKGWAANRGSKENQEERAWVPQPFSFDSLLGIEVEKM